MAAVTLSAATRSNLLALQNATAAQSVVQNRLTTGRAVNSALDNPVNFFTAVSLWSRSADLASLLDATANGIQTTRAALKGIDSMRSLLGVAKGLVDRAARAPSAVQTPAAVPSVASNYTAADIVGAQNASAPDPSHASAPANSSINMGLHGEKYSSVVDFLSPPLKSGDTITVSRGAVSQVYTYDPGGTGTAVNPFKFNSELGAAVNRDFQADYGVSNDKVEIFTEDMQPLTIRRSDQPGDLPRSGPMIADTLTFAVNGGVEQKVTFRKPADPANGYFSDRASLVAAINAKSGSSALTAAIDPVSLNVRLTAGNKDDTFRLSGSSLSALGFDAQPYEPTPSLDDSQVTYTIGEGSERKSVTIAYGYASNETTTLAQLNAQLATADMRAVIEPSPVGKVVVKPKGGREADRIELSTPITWVAPNPRVANGVATLTGAGAGQYGVDAVFSEPGATVRRQIASEYTALRAQISGIAQDASYNGQNLLMGGDVRFQFNEDNSSSYTIKGSLLDADGLGVLTALDGNFLDSQSTSAAFDQIASAMSSLESVASQYTTGLNTAGIRTDHTQKLIGLLRTGNDSLTLADMNEEAVKANSLSLRQQLTTSALSLADQAQSQILQLLRS